MKTKRPLLIILLGLSLAFLLFGVQPESVHAATITVNTSLDEQDGSCSDVDCSLRDAIQTAAAGDTIIFDASLSGQTIYLALGQLTIGKGLTIDGSSLSDHIDISGNNTFRVFLTYSQAEVTLRDLDIVDGHVADGSGGSGIYNQRDLTVIGCTISDNTTPNNGGGIRNTGTLTVVDSVVSGNAAGYGGGIRNEGVLTVFNSTVSDNTADFGGGIDNYVGSMIVDGVTLERNTATYYGGGIVTGATATIEDSIFIDNSAHSGGAIDSHESGVTLTLTRCTFIGNTADVDGGALVNDAATVEVNNSSFDNNSAGLSGGGILNRNTGMLTINDSTLTGNTASSLSDGYGGAIENLGTLQLNGSTLSGNTAHYNGGAIENWGGDLTATDCTFATNSAANGGAINNNTGGTLTVLNSTFESNVADGAGGALFNDNSSTTTMENSTLCANSASYEGGGIYNVSGTVTVSNATFDGNIAGSGGGINNQATLGYRNTIVNSLGGNDCVNSGTITENVNNLVADGSCGAMFSGDAHLGQLQDNGGPTQTCDLLPDSPAIDAGDNSTCLSIDQRYYVRPVDGGTGNITCDIGAFEYASTPLAVMLASFAAEPQGNYVLVTWETVSELDNAGFNLYRASTPDGADRALLAFLPAQSPGSSQGAVYSYQDGAVNAGATYWYWLEAIDFSGATTLYGPVYATLEAPTAVTLAQAAAAPALHAVASAALPAVVSVLVGLALIMGGWLRLRRSGSRASRTE